MLLRSIYCNGQAICTGKTPSDRLFMSRHTGSISPGKIKREKHVKITNTMTMMTNDKIRIVLCLGTFKAEMGFMLCCFHVDV